MDLRIDDIDAMRMGVDYRAPIKLRDYQVYVRPLANSEVINCYSNVAEYMSTIPEKRRTRIMEDNAIAREFLKMASAEYGKYPGKITDPILDQMTNEEVMFLYKEWMAICDKVNPQLENLPTERIKELVDAIKKNTPKDLDSQLTELSFGQMRSILSYLMTQSD